MLRKALISAIAVNLACGSVLAADLYIDDTVAPTVSVTDWTGFYAGLHLGLGQTVIYYDEMEEIFEPEGLLAGVQAGGNWQHESFVLGVEGDISWSGLSAPLNEEGDINDDINASIDWLATLRGRAGFDLNGVMPYVTGGLAASGLTFDDDGDVYSETLTGYVLGSGLEAKVDENWSIKAEYLYANLGETAYPEIDEDERNDIEVHIVRFGLNYAF